MHVENTERERDRGKGRGGLKLPILCSQGLFCGSESSWTPFNLQQFGQVKRAG